MRLLNPLVLSRHEFEFRGFWRIRSRYYCHYYLSCEPQWHQNVLSKNRCSAYIFPALNPFRLTFLRIRESDAALVAMRDVYVSHPAAPTVKTVPIDVSAHAHVNQFVNRRKFVVSEMFYGYLRHYMSSGVHHPAVAKHDDAQRRVRSAALKQI